MAKRIWLPVNQPCGKLLEGMLPLWPPHLQERGERLTVALKRTRVYRKDDNALRGAVESGKAPQVIVGVWAAEAQVSLGWVDGEEKKQ